MLSQAQTKLFENRCPVGSVEHRGFRSFEALETNCSSHQIEVNPTLESVVEPAPCFYMPRATYGPWQRGLCRIFISHSFGSC